MDKSLLCGSVSIRGVAKLVLSLGFPFNPSNRHWHFMFKHHPTHSRNSLKLALKVIIQTNLKRTHTCMFTQVCMLLVTYIMKKTYSPPSARCSPWDIFPSTQGIPSRNPSERPRLALLGLGEGAAHASLGCRGPGFLGLKLQPVHLPKQMRVCVCVCVGVWVCVGVCVRVC